jgi:molybdopterin-guanine dinucleotide biosynthesis protein B
MAPEGRIMDGPRVLGVVGWSGAGKTTLLIKLIPLLTRRGLRVSTLKHAHHAFDIDVPGKDSYEHRKAGAGEVLVFSGRRWALVHEVGEAPEPTLAALLSQLSPCDLVLIEGFKGEPHAKLEVFRPALGKPPIYPTDPNVVAVASDAAADAAGPPWADLNDPEAVAALVLAMAEPRPA